MKAMILAAGRGERMRPLSEARAKPSLPVLDEPMVLRLVRQLSEQGVEAAVVNVHANAATLERALANAPIPITLSHETELRGSGGGIRAAREWLRDGPFLVVNGDMALDLDLAALVRAHEQSRAVATLALRDDPRKHRFGTIGYDSGPSVCRITDRVSVRTEKGNALFIGVHVLEPSVFDHMPDSPVFGIMEQVYCPLLEGGERLGVWLQPNDAAWWPIGSPAELIDANLLALERALVREDRGDALIDRSAKVDGEVSGPVWIGAGAHVDRGARVGPGTVIGAGARVRSGLDLTQCVWLPDAAPAGEIRSPVLTRAVGFDDRIWCDG